MSAPLAHEETRRQRPSRTRARTSRGSLQIAFCLCGCFGAFVGEPELLSVGLFVFHAGDLKGGLVARAVAVNDELLTNLQRVLRDAVANEAVRRAAFDAPLLNHPVGGFDVDPDPRVRIDELNFRDGAPEYQRFIFAEYRIPRMMCTGRRGAEREDDTY